jgi:hypothetical protein
MTDYLRDAIVAEDIQARVQVERAKRSASVVLASSYGKGMAVAEKRFQVQITVQQVAVDTYGRAVNDPNVLLTFQVSDWDLVTAIEHATAAAVAYGEKNNAE